MSGRWIECRMRYAHPRTSGSTGKVVRLRRTFPACSLVGRLIAGFIRSRRTGRSVEHTASRPPAGGHSQPVRISPMDGATGSRGNASERMRRRHWRQREPCCTNGSGDERIDHDEAALKCYYWLTVVPCKSAGTRFIS